MGGGGIYSCMGMNRRGVRKDVGVYQEEGGGEAAQEGKYGEKSHVWVLVAGLKKFLPQFFQQVALRTRRNQEEAGGGGQEGRRLREGRKWWRPLGAIRQRA